MLRILDNFRHLRQTSGYVQAERAPSLGSRTSRKILILNGPNLNMLGTREPAIYGKEDLRSINERLSLRAKREGAVLEVFQSNHEFALHST